MSAARHAAPRAPAPAVSPARPGARVARLPPTVASATAELARACDREPEPAPGDRVVLYARVEACARVLRAETMGSRLWMRAYVRMLALVAAAPPPPPTVAPGARGHAALEVCARAMRAEPMGSRPWMNAYVRLIGLLDELGGR